MAIALVSQGTVTASGSPAFGQPTTAGDLLLMWGWSNDGSGTDPFTVSGTGWTRIITGGGSFNWVTLWYKPNCGASESAPSFTNPAVVTSMLTEFSGAATSPLDQTGNSTSSPVAATGADTAASDLVTVLSVWNGGNSGPTMTVVISGSNGSALSGTFTNNNGAGAAPFYTWGWAVNDSSLGSTPDSATLAVSPFENAPAAVIASFKPAGGGPPPVVVPAAPNPEAASVSGWVMLPVRGRVGSAV